MSGKRRVTGAAKQARDPRLQSWKLWVLYEDDSERVVTVEAVSWHDARDKAMRPEVRGDGVAAVGCDIIENPNVPQHRKELVHVKVALDEAMQMIRERLLVDGRLQPGRATEAFEGSTGAYFVFSQYREVEVKS